MDNETLGLSWIKLGLQDVLYDPKTQTIFTPNTGTRQSMQAVPAPGQEADTEDLQEQPDDDTMELRFNHNHNERGRFSSGGGGRRGGGGKKGGKTKYAPSPQRNPSPVQLSPKRYARLCGVLNTKYPELKPEDGVRQIYDANYCYDVTADGFGGMIIRRATKISKKGKK